MRVDSLARAATKAMRRRCAGRAADSRLAPLARADGRSTPSKPDGLASPKGATRPCVSASA
eukprot:11159187-Alexandrium_andersonii.AAC.1